MCGVTDPFAAPPQPDTPDADYPSVLPDLPGRTATEMKSANASAS